MVDKVKIAAKAAKAVLPKATIANIEELFLDNVKAKTGFAIEEIDKGQYRVTGVNVVGKRPIHFDFTVTVNINK